MAVLTLPLQLGQNKLSNKQCNERWANHWVLLWLRAHHKTSEHRAAEHMTERESTDVLKISTAYNKEMKRGRASANLPMLEVFPLFKVEEMNARAVLYFMAELFFFWRSLAIYVQSLWFNFCLRWYLIAQNWNQKKFIIKNTLHKILFTLLGCIE